MTLIPKPGEIWIMPLEGGGCCEAVITCHTNTDKVYFAYICGGRGHHEVKEYELLVSRFLESWKHSEG